MRKLLFLVSTVKRAGIIIQLYNLVKYIDRRKFEVIIITLSPETHNTMLFQFQDLDIKFESLNLSRISGIFNGKRKLLSALNRIKPDIIHTHGIRSDTYGLTLKRKYIIVSTMHNYPFFDYPMIYGKILGKLMAYKQLSIMKRRKNFIACSESVADFFKERNNVSIQHIQNGVDIEFYNRIGLQKKLDLKKKLNIPVDKKIIVSVGSLIARKDMTTVVNGFKNCHLKDAILLIVGDGVESQQLESLRANATAIRFLGNVNNVKEYLQISDFFVSASLAEGLPNTVLEAMACGLPVVLSKITPHLEVLSGNENYNYFFDIKNHHKLSELLKQIVSEDYITLSNSMYNIIRGNFTAEIMSKKYQELYCQLLEER